MKRDPDLIRSLLLLIEKHEKGSVKGREIEVDGFSSSQIMGHLNMIADAGFISAEYWMSKSNTARIVSTEYVFDLTWKGHEYLNSVRDPKIWAETKNLSHQAGSTSFEFLLDIAKGLARQALRSHGLIL